MQSFSFLFLTSFKTRATKFLYSFEENEIVLKTIEENIDNFSNTYVIVKNFEGHVVKKVKELYECAVEV
jgi:hypothetical protein